MLPGSSGSERQVIHAREHIGDAAGNILFGMLGFAVAQIAFVKHRLALNLIEADDRVALVQPFLAFAW